MGRIRIRDLKHRLENRRKSLSRLSLGSPIDNPSESFGPSSYDLLEGLEILPSRGLVIAGERKTEGAAFDFIVVEACDGSLHHSGEFTVAFEKWNSLRLGDGDSSNDKSEVNSDGTAITSTALKIQRVDGVGEAWFCVHDAEEILDTTAQEGGGHCPWEDLKPFLKEGANPVVFCCLRESQTRAQAILQFARAVIWLWKVSDKIVISDIDGTLTKSNARGVLGTILTDQYDKACHPGVCHLLSKMAISNEMEAPPSVSSTTRILYLTSRPIHLANKTRDFLSGLTQQQQGAETEASTNESPPIYGLPQGPLLGFGGNLAKVLSMEVLSKTAQAFKAGELEKHIAGPFRRANQHHSNLVLAAFGNNLNDVQAYHKIGVDMDRIFLIDKNSTIVTFDKESQASTNDDKGEFQPHSWYNDRISTTFEKGYLDPKLHSFLGVDKNDGFI